MQGKGHHFDMQMSYTYKKKFSNNQKHTKEQAVNQGYTCKMPQITATIKFKLFLVNYDSEKGVL